MMMSNMAPVRTSDSKCGRCSPFSIDIVLLFRVMLTWR